MAMEELQGIIQALVAHKQQSLERQRLEQSAAYQQQEIEDRKEQRKIQAEQYQRQAKHDDLVDQANVASRKLADSANIQKILSGYSETGIVPQGLEVNPVADNDQQVILRGQIAGQPVSGQTWTPQGLAKLRADLYKITEGPKEAHQFAMKAFEAENAQEKARQAQQSQFSLQEMLEEGRDRRANASNAMHEHIAAANASQKNVPTIGQPTAEHYLKGFYTGDYSIDKLHTIFPNKADQMLMTKGMGAAEGTFFTKSQVEDLPKFTYAAQVVPDMERVQRILTVPVHIDDGTPEGFDTDPKAALIPGTRSYMLTRRIISQVKEGLIGSLPIFGQGSRPSNVRAAAVVEALSPSILPSADISNGQILKKIKSLLGEQFDATYGTLSEHQQKIVKHKVGMSGWGGGLPKDEVEKPKPKKSLDDPSYYGQQPEAQ